MLQEANQNYGLVTLLSRLDFRVVPITFSVTYRSVCAQTGSYRVIIFLKQKKTCSSGQCFGNLIMNFQTFCEVVEDDNSSAQSTEFLLARQSKCKL